MTQQEKDHYTKLGNHYNSDRDCNSCINHTEKGCCAWECKHITKEKAIKAVDTLEKIQLMIHAWQFDNTFYTDELVAMIERALDKALGEVGETD